jgi:hypothetical protein
MLINLTPSVTTAQRPRRFVCNAADQLASKRQQHSVNTNANTRMVGDPNHVEKGRNQPIDV